MRNNNNFPKSKFLMCLTTLKKTDEKNGKPVYQVISSEWKKCNGREFRQSYYEEIDNGIHHEIKIVNEKPTSFVVNQIYMLSTRDKVWIWVEEN